MKNKKTIISLNKKQKVTHSWIDKVNLYAKLLIPEIGYRVYNCPTKG